MNFNGALSLFEQVFDGPSLSQGDKDRSWMQNSFLFSFPLTCISCSQNSSGRVPQIFPACLWITQSPLIPPLSAGLRLQEAACVADGPFSLGWLFTATAAVTAEEQ